MFVQDCIDSSLPFLRLTDTAGYALDLTEESKAEILPVVDNKLFLGSLSEKFLLECDEKIAVSELKENFLQNKIIEGTHVFDVLKKSVEVTTYFHPVVNAEDEYIGTTSPKQILNTLVRFSSVTTSGGVMVLELETRNYSLTEISKIVESNNAMILHTMMATSVNQNFMQIALKINKNDLKDIQLAFERYHYNVVAVFHQSEYEMQLKERFDRLMKYLEV